MARTFGAKDKKKRKYSVPESERQRRREQCKTMKSFDQYKGYDAGRINFSLTLSQAYYIEKERKRRHCSISDIVRSCLDFVIKNNIIID